MQEMLHPALQTWCAFNPDKPIQLLPTRCLIVYPDRLKQFTEQQTYCLRGVTNKHLKQRRCANGQSYHCSQKAVNFST